MDDLSVRNENEEAVLGLETHKIKRHLPKVLENPIIREFLEDKSNNESFYEFLSNPNLENMKILDQKFRHFYRYNHAIRYLSGVIKRYSIDYDKKVTLRSNRFLLIMDKPIKVKDNSSISMAEILPDKKYPTIESIILRENELLYTENEHLYKALQKLTNKQLMILFLYYEKGFNNKEISKVFGQTEQNISYWHKKTLEQLKESINTFQSEAIDEKK